jgi:hypothetical protein
MTRLIHTGDVHLGARLQFLGALGQTIRAQLRTTFARVLTLAQDRDAAAVLVAGDLFDSLHPEAVDLRCVVTEIRRIHPIPVILAPGTHDLLSPDSPYLRLPDPPDNCLVITQEGPQTIRLQGGALAIHARATRAARGDVPPLTDLRPDPAARFNIAMAHASVERGDIGGDPEHDAIVTEAAVRACGMQYLALGHWHTCAEQWPGLPCATWYCGSPEPVQFGLDLVGTALEVVLGDGRPQVIPHRVGTYRWRDEALAGPQTLARLHLRGTLPSGVTIDLAGLQADLADRFAYLHLDDRDLQVRWEDFDPETVFPPGTIGAAYVALAQEALQAAGEAERDHWQEVLRRGTALLAGREEVQ